MKKVLSAAAVSLLALVVNACSDSSTTKPPAVPVALKVEPLKFTERTLANGLKVYAMPDPNTANVSVQVWYDVGSKDDPAGRSGFAHLFEHIMFKATKNMPPETLDRLTEDVGGFNNASTYDDFTNYYQVVPANHLERLLWAEAERMGSLVVDEAIFKSERDVVKEEYRQRILASPYGKLFGLYLAQANFVVHPYGRPGIGSIENLDAATVADVRAFHAQYYRPDNAVLVVAGNFDQAQFDKWVDQYFGPIATPKRPIPRVTAVEPARNAPKEYTVYEPNTPLPAISISYPQPNSLSPDLAALTVLDAIMSKGESSRLYQSMVYTQQIAAQVFTNLEATRDPGAYTLAAILSDGKSADDGVKSLMAEIAKMRDTQVTAAELDEAKNELVSETLEGRETAFGKANELANAAIRFRDGKYADKLLADIQAVTAADVQRVAKTILDDNKRVTIKYLSAETKPANANADTISTAATVQAQTLDIPANEITVFALAAEAERIKAPAPQAPVAAKLPTPNDTKLANGLRVIVASKRDVPIVSAELVIRSGTGNDPETLGGLASLTADVMTKGTKTRSATDIARQIEALGAELSAGAGADNSEVALASRADRIGEAMAIMADVARNPAFAAEEVERQRQQTLDGLQVGLRQPGTVARLAMTRVLFGLGPYGSVASPKSIAAIKPADLSGFHANHWRPDNAVLVISGDLSAEDGTKLAQKYFGDWDGSAQSIDRFIKETPPTMRAIVVDLPKSGQAAVSFGMIGVPRTAADYFPALVANSVLGGGYSARLNQEIRIKRGLSYGVSSGFAARQAPGPIIALAQTKNESAVQVVDLMNQEFAKMIGTEVPAAELGARQANLIGSFGRYVETASGLAGQLATLAAFDIPLAKLNSYVADVAAVTPASAKEVAAKLYDPKKASMVVVGDGTVFFNALKKKRPDAVRIPLDKLNLDSATLQ